MSPIDTTILLCGVLMAREYFHDAKITQLANSIYRRVNWRWMMNGGTTFAMGWTPEYKFIGARWDIYCELMMMYLLAIGAPAYNIPASSWNAFSRPMMEFEGYHYISGPDPLFVHQYSHAWFDFRNVRDQYANYFENSAIATYAHKLFCQSIRWRFPDYDDNTWGITASDSRLGYQAWGGPPEIGYIDGTVVPCAAGGSVPFLPKETIACLANLYNQYGGRVEEVWLRGCVQSADRLDRCGCARDRSGNHDADGGELSHRVHLGYVHEESRGAESDEDGGLPAILPGSYRWQDKTLDLGHDFFTGRGRRSAAVPAHYRRQSASS